MNDDPSGHVWREQVAGRLPLAADAAILGRLIEEDHDPAEISYYEASADPDAQALDDAQRSYAGQYRRRVRRLRERERHRKLGDLRGLEAWADEVEATQAAYRWPGVHLEGRHPGRPWT